MNDQWAPPSVQDDQQQAVGLWPAGNYKGTLLSGKLISSMLKGTPGFELKFDVNGTEKTVNIWISENAADIAIGQLEAIGWNGDMANPDFGMIGSDVPLYMKHDTYKNRQKEAWSVSSFSAKPPPSPTDSNLARFAARFKNRAAAPPPPPAGKPTLPPPPKPAPAAPAPKPAPPKAPAPLPAKAPSKNKASTLDEAWQAWVNEGCDDAEKFYKAVEAVARTTDTMKVTPAQWQQVADHAESLSDLPF